jgi:hypothetical protein
MSSQGIYIYGIIEEPRQRKFSFPGVGSPDVFTINHEQIAAVVSESEDTEIDPTRRNVQAHTVAQETLMKEYTLLPMAFGMVASGENEVSTLLSNNYEGLRTEMRRLTGRIEVELKVFWEQEAIIKEIQDASQEFNRLREKVKTAVTQAELRNLMIQAGQLVEAMVQEWKTKYAELICSTLQALAVDSKINNPVGIKNLLNASFLIDKSRENEFKEEVYRLDTRFQGKMNIKYVGPLPPYNFVDLKLEAVKC